MNFQSLMRSVWRHALLIITAALFAFDMPVSATVTLVSAFYFKLDDILFALERYDAIDIADFESATIKPQEEKQS